MPLRSLIPKSEASASPPLPGVTETDAGRASARLLQAERRLVVVGAAIVFAIVALLGPIYLRGQKNNLKNGAATELTAIAALKLTQLGSWRAERIADVRRMVHMPDFTRAVADLQQNRTSIAALDEVQGWIDEIALAEEFESAALFGPDLQPLTAEMATVALDADARTLLAKAAAAHDAITSDFHADAQGALHLDIVTPMFSREGVFLGAAAFRAKLDRTVFPLLGTWPVPSQTGEILMGRREGDALLYVARDGHETVVPAPAETPQTRARAAAGVLEERLDYRGIPVLGIRRQVPGSAWFIVAKIDEAEAYAGLRGTTAMLAIATVATLCAVVSAAAFVWRRRKHVIQQQELAAERRRLEERRVAQAELRRSEEEHRLLFLNHPIPMWLLDADTLRFVAVNVAAIEHYGYTREEFLEMTIRDIRPEADLPHVAANLPQQNVARRRFGPVRHRKKNGEVILVEISSEPAAYAGRPARLVLAQDVTARIASERRLRESAELLDKASDAIVVTDLAGRITFWNKGAERVLGWSAAEALGRTSPELFGSAPTAVHGIDGVTGAAIQKMHITRRSGEPLVLDVSLTLLRDEAGAPSGFLRIATDITDKEALEEKFLRAQRLESIGMLAAGITHDLNNVLAPVAMVAGLFRLQLTNPEHLRFVDTLDQCAARGAALVHQILGFVHGISGDPRALQVRYLIRDIVSMIRETYPKSITLVDEVPKDLSAVVGNPTQIHQVLLNLCVNARDAMPDGGTLCLRARNEMLDAQAAAAVDTGGAGLPPAPGAWVVLEVADTGSGIPPEVQAKMWAPFFTTKGVDKGTGLGLSTVRGIVEAHHGFIAVATESGRGTTFRIYLPATQTAAPAAEPCGASVPVQGSGELILLAEDEEFVRETTRAVLTKAGYKTVVAKHGIEAAELFETLRAEIRLVITDRDMPELDGGGLVQLIRQRAPATKILAISGADSTRLGSRVASMADASAFLAKPFTPRTLLTCVRQLLEADPQAPKDAAEEVRSKVEPATGAEPKMEPDVPVGLV